MAQVAPLPEEGQGDADLEDGADQFTVLQRCRIWEFLKRGELHLITRSVVQELYSALDAEDTGEVLVDDLNIIMDIPELGIREEDIENLQNDCDTEGNGKVSFEALFKALTMGSLAFKTVLESFKPNKMLKSNECSREGMIAFMTDEYDTMSALWSLPQTILLFVVFFICVEQHLRIDTAYTMQTSLKSAIVGEGPPYLEKYVHDIPTLWDWMESSWINVHFQNDLETFPYPGRLQSFNQVMGGISLTKVDIGKGKCDQSADLQRMYDQVDASCNTNAEIVRDTKFFFYQEGSDAIKAVLDSLKSNVWWSLNTSKIDQHTLFYNAYLGAFTDFHMIIGFSDDVTADDAGRKDGMMRFKFYQETFLADPYFNMAIVIADFLFVGIIVRMLVQEMQEMIPCILGGIDTFLGYWDIPNIVDWFSMSLSVAVTSVWATICYSVTFYLQPAIKDLPNYRLDNIIATNNTYFSKEQFDSVVDRGLFELQLQDLLDVSSNIAYYHRTLRSLIFLNTFVMMMKVFKAFRANPRLNVVILTLTTSAVDLVHFMIVFLIINIVFSLMGYTIFGNVARNFSDTAHSLMECWRVLMGADDTDLLEPAGAAWSYLWIVSYQFFVGLILLNMTVAIIMDAYIEVNSGGDKLTIWTQVQQAVKTKQETRGFLDLSYLIGQFQNTDEPAHPGPKITARSLRRAFERDKMTKANAEYLVRRTRAYAAEKEGEKELSLTDAIRVIGQVRTQVLKINCNTESLLELLKIQAKAPQEARLDAIMQGIDPDDIHFNGGSNYSNAVVALAGQTTSIDGAANAKMSNNIMNNQKHISGNSFSFLSTTNPADYVPKKFALTDQEGPLSSAIPANTDLSVALPPLPAAAVPQTAGIPFHVVQNQLNQMMSQNNAAMMHIYAIANTIESMQLEMREHDLVEVERTTLVDRRLWALEKRSERVEKACDILRNVFQTLDFDEILGMPGKISESVAVQVRKMTAGCHSSGNVPQAGDSISGDVVRQREKQLEERLTRLSEQVDHLVNHAKEQAETKMMLWKIDMGLRQLKHKPPVQQPTVSPSLRKANAFTNHATKGGRMAEEP